MRWQEYFIVKGIHPGRVVTHRYGTLDLRRKEIPINIIKELFDQGFPYLKLTEKGEAELYTQSKETDSKTLPDPVNEQTDDIPKSRARKKSQPNSSK
jgi:hypothetical protein